MEPNYANYSYNELLEALETIDHHAYPDRVNSIKARLATLDDQNGNVSIRGDYKDISLLLFLICSVLGVMCTWMLIKGNENDFRAIVGAFLLPAAPFLYWHYKKKWKTHAKDHFILNKEGVLYSFKGQDAKLAWANITSIELSRTRYHSSLSFESKHKDKSIYIDIKKFRCSQLTVENFIRKKAAEHGMPYYKSTLWRGKKRIA
jgi:predicted DNA binding CopG/RHH family protein